MRFRAGDDLVARIRASVLRKPHGRGERREPGPAPPPTFGGDQNSQPPMARITYYGRHGEMGHPDDRAADWGEADTRGERS